MSGSPKPERAVSFGQGMTEGAGAHSHRGILDSREKWVTRKFTHRPNKFHDHKEGGKGETQREV